MGTGSNLAFLPSQIFQHRVRCYGRKWAMHRKDAASDSRSLVGTECVWVYIYDLSDRFCDT